MTITVLGAGGWIGAALVADLRRQGVAVRSIDRADLPVWLGDRDPQGPVIYTIGLTADFRHQPHATVDAHVSLLSQVLQRSGVQQLLYLSSTRVYARSNNTHETAMLPCMSSDPSDLYNLSKLLGEALVLQDPRPGFKVVRLSNVVGFRQPSTTFLGDLLAAARDGKVVTIKQPAETTKNYVALADVVRLLPLIAHRSQHRLYNVGSRYNLSHSEVASWLERQGATVRFADSGVAYSDLSFQPIEIDRLVAEYPPPRHPFRLITLKHPT